MGAIIHDLRYAVRALWRTPRFTISAVLTLALGIGANTAIFTVLNKVLLRPLPIHDSARIVTVHQQFGGRALSGFVYPEFRQFQSGSTEMFEALSASGGQPVHLSVNQDTLQASVQFVSELYFDLLGIKPVLGRNFGMGSTLLSGFSVVAFTLAVLGIYGLVAYAVTRRTSEIGVRIALGAASGTVVKLMMAQSLVPVAAGTAAGLFGAYALARLTQPFLFGLTPHDPSTFVGVTILLLAASLLASYIPARNAARIDPLTALRTE